MNVLIPSILLAGGVMFFILHPLMMGREAPMDADEDELTEAQHRKRVALLALRDVEYDFHAGKLDEPDYRAMKRQISAEALEALSQEEDERTLRAASAGGHSDGDRDRPDDAAVEAEITALRDAIRHGMVCPQCGHPNHRRSRFCGDCGSALPPAGSSSAAS